jgi:hypothetical protein
MSWPGASFDEIPEQPFPGWSGGEPDEPLLDGLLAGQPLPPEAPEQLHEVAELFARLTGPAAPGLLTGEAAARSAFARAAGSPVRASSIARAATRWRLPGPYFRLNARLAAALTAVAVGLGGGAAAYAGALPGPIQDFAHHLIGAPAARQAPLDRQEGASLCSAYERAKAHRGSRARAAAFQKLDQAAGGAGKIDAYCAAAGRPGLAPPAPRARHPEPQPAKPNGNHQVTGHGNPSGRGDPKAPGKPKLNGRTKAHARTNAHGSATAGAQDHSKADGPPGASR